MVVGLRGIDAAGVVTGGLAAVGDVEAAIEAREGVAEDDDQLDGVVEDVVARLVVEPGWVVGWADDKGHAGAEAGAEGEEGAGEGEEVDLGAHATLAELVHGGLAGEEQAECDDGEGEEGEDGEVGRCRELDIAKPLASLWVEGIETIHNRRHNHDQTSTDAEEQELEEERRRLPPSQLGMIRPQNALREDEVDDEEEDDARIGKDTRRDGEADVGGMGRQADAQRVGDDAGHGETEEQGRQDELVRPPAVDLEDGHVEGGAADEEDDEDRGDGHVDGSGRAAAKLGNLGEVGRALVMLLVLLRARGKSIGVERTSICNTV